MRFEIVIPKFGSPSDEVRLEEWLVKPGDYIEAGRPIFVVTTDKATVEVEAFRDGFVQELLVQPGSSIPAGTIVAILSTEEGEDKSPIPERQKTTSEGLAGDRPESRREASPTGLLEGRVLASPLARRMAKEAGIPLAGVHGSGKQGQIMRRDVEARLGVIQDQAAEADRGEVKATRVPISRMRRSIAERTRQAKVEAPHFYATKTIDMTEAKSALAQLSSFAQREGLIKPTMNDLVLKATALALRKVPEINASYRGDEILYFEEVNIGVVVGLEEGLIIPVIRRADRKNLFSISEETRRLKERAKQGQLSSSQLLGSTFTLSNLGMYGLDSFTAVINPPEAGVLAVGAVKQAPAYWNEQVLPRWQMTATLSVDHRLVDGITAARFMKELQVLLENPITLTLEAAE